MKRPRIEHDFWIGEPMDLEVQDLRVRRGGAFLNALSLEYQLYAVGEENADEPGEAVLNDEDEEITGAIAIDTVDGDEDGDDDGDYYARIDQSADLDDVLEANTTYFLRIFGSSGATAVNRWIKIRANYRAET